MGVGIGGKVAGGTSTASANPVQGVGNPLFDKVTNSTYSSFGGGAYYTLVTPQDLLAGGFFSPGGALSAGELRSLIIGDNTPLDPEDFAPRRLQLPASSNPTTTPAAPAGVTTLPSWLLIVAAVILLLLLF